MNLVWLCPAVRKPVGGVKVIYRQAAVAHDLMQGAGIGGSYVLHPNTWRGQARWYDGSVVVRRKWFGLRWAGKPTLSDISAAFDPVKDFVILPEVWVRKYGVQLHRLGVPYAIYVQAGYYINRGVRAELKEAYEHAQSILVVSQDVQRCVAQAFPAVAESMHRLHVAIDPERFCSDASVPKENLITYMPRKMADHASKVLFFLQPHLPSHWRIHAIDGLGEAQVARTLQRSRIFLSFSHFEGLGLPPLEAALCGNHVVGYTGQGGKEFWVRDAFTPVEVGDVVTYAQTVAALAKQIDAGLMGQPDPGCLAPLRARYSPEQERQDLQALLVRLKLLAA